MKNLTNYRQSLAQLTKRVATSRFMRWWTGELAGLVPARLRKAGTDLDKFAVISLELPNVTLSRLVHGKLEKVQQLELKSLDESAQHKALSDALERMQPGQRGVILSLPPERVLSKTIMLPMAAEENLHQVLEFQMEQYTPFRPSQIYLGYRVESRDFERGQLKVQFAATPRTEVDVALGWLAACEAEIQAILPENMLGGEPVNLLPEQGRTHTFDLVAKRYLWLGTAVLLLGMVALILPLVIKHEAIAQIQPLLEKGKKAAEAADALRRELEGKVAEHNFLLEKKMAAPPVIQVLEELSRILPDNTWVSQLDIRGKELQFQGETAASSKLVGLFEQSQMFHDTNFRAPLTKGQGPDAERFHLATELTPLPTPRQVNQISVPAAANAATATAQAETKPATENAQTPQTAAELPKSVLPPTANATSAPSPGSPARPAPAPASTLEKPLSSESQTEGESKKP